MLSGNRNFEGRIHPEVKQNYLASPPLVVAYALAGTLDIDLVNDPIGQGSDGEDVYLKDIWPTQQEIHDLIESSVKSEMFRESYGEVFEGGEEWESLDVPEGDRYEWRDDSTYVKRAPYFDDMDAEAPEGFETIEGARVLVKLGDSVTTDHISPAGSFKEDTPAGEYLVERGVDKKDFNSYGSRRGNHEIMMRGTFANVRLRNQLAPDTNGGWTKKDGDEKTIFEAAMEYQEEGTPLLVLAGKEYGSGSSRDWAAKGPRLLGIKFVIAESYERIHRSNLVGMGILPLQFADGESADSLDLDGSRGVQRRRPRGGREDRQGQGGRHRVRGDRPDRHAERVAVLPPRRDPALRPALAEQRRLITHHELCFGCGQANLFGLQLEVDARDDGVVAGRFFVKQDHQGPPGYAHGGIVATAVDEAMSLLIHAQGIHALTTGLDVRLRAPAPVGAFVDVEARIDERDGRKLTLSATAASEGVEVATARGVFVEVERPS